MKDKSHDLHEAAHHEVAAHGHEAAHHGAHHAAEHGAHHTPHELPNFITFLNEKFSDFALVQILHEWENIFFSVLAASVLAFVFTKAAKRESLIPEGLRNFVEAIVEGAENFLVSIMGEGGRKHVPFLGTLFFYILLMNWSGLIPFSKSPTANWSITAAMAIVTVFYIHISGIRALGFWHYLHHMASSPKNVPHWVIGVVLIFPLFFVLDWIVLPFSLSLRLFANISSEDSLLLNFAMLAKDNWIMILMQIFANCLALLFSLVQAFVFTLLTTVYVFMMMPHDDHEHTEGEHAH